MTAAETSQSSEPEYSQWILGEERLLTSDFGDLKGPGQLTKG